MLPPMVGRHGESFIRSRLFIIAFGTGLPFCPYVADVHVHWIKAEDGGYLGTLVKSVAALNLYLLNVLQTFQATGGCFRQSWS